MLMNMKDILTVAKENRFALPAFNISDYSMFLGIMDVCEETDSPVIIEIHPDELDFIGPEMVTAITAEISGRSSGRSRAGSHRSCSTGRSYLLQITSRAQRKLWRRPTL